jgi:tRNA modification GTPase
MIDPALATSLAGGVDTIVAVATPPGRGALAIVRMSGAHAMEIASRHLLPWPLEPRTATLCAVHNGDDERLLDHAVVTTFIAPASFTGEDSVEICTHGGLVVPGSVVAALISSGAREALPGEFTRRAVLTGKLDIVQAEAIGDLIDAGSLAMQQAALHQLGGALSARIQQLREDLLGLESLIAYDIDFPEEDDGPISPMRVQQSIDSLRATLEMLLATVPAGELIREGALVVIAGEPNVGKSSLFNALAGKTRAIVTDVPGTTRDAIEVLLDTGSWPIRLVDTAGLRESDEAVEKLGIEVSGQYLAAAHLVLACGDSGDSIEKTVTAVRDLASSSIIPVQTKADLNAGSNAARPRGVVRTSAMTGEGLDFLQDAIDSALARDYSGPIAEMPMLTRARHIRAIKEAHQELVSFEGLWRRKTLPATVAAVHLRAAASALEEMIGAISAEDVLDRVFSSFCVGK